MKKLLFMFLFLFLMESVSANDSVQFYYTEEKVDEMWITRIEGNTIKSSNPYVLRRKSDNSYVYCLQPFVLLNQKEDYTAYYQNHKILNITDEDWERISNLAYFGYQYPGHEEKKWYGITQYLIWKTVAKKVTIYFADGKNGKQINPYQKEIEEIENLIKEYQKLKKIDKRKLVFKNVEEWNDWKQKSIILKNAIMPLHDDNYIFELPNNEGVFGVDVFYYHNNGQNVYHPGLLSHMNMSFEIEFLKGKIRLQKKNVENTFISNENSLEGAKYGIYKDGVLVETIETNKDGIATSALLEYGVYTIKEISASKGYLVDENIYTISIDKEEFPIEVYEKQIEKEIQIQKWYGSGTYKVEEDAIFEIYQEDNLVLTITTDEDGLAHFKLPYGTYRLHQVKGKEGYQNIQDLVFQVNEEFESEMKLYNKEIIEEVPDTGIIDWPLLWFYYLKDIRRLFYVI